MNKSDMWLTLLASVGVGAAAYYTISKSNKPVEKAIENITPMLTNMNTSNNQGNNSSTDMGTHGMS
ncbi:MAG TPA: hypothetical protein VK029_06820 [Pseudogracilibacillus sp.]|nr:hypothetical protein [Pseudogracilibacillus sp.]